MSLAWEITREDVWMVLNQRMNKPCKLDSPEVEAAYEAATLQADRVEKAALRGDELEEQTEFACQEIEAILREEARVPHTFWLVSIDNGAGYCADLPGRFSDAKAATDAGEAWLQQFYLDNGVAPEDQEDDEATYVVGEVECQGCAECCTDGCPGCAHCHEDRAAHE